jgi:hypothetical protein
MGAGRGNGDGKSGWKTGMEKEDGKSGWRKRMVKGDGEGEPLNISF